MTSIMKTHVHKFAAIALALLCLWPCGMPTAHAQVNDAANALNSAVHHAKRLLRGSYARRRDGRRSRKKRRTADKDPAPLPRRKPARSATERRPVKSANTKPEEVTDAEPTVADIWTNAEISAASAACRKVLKNVKAKFESAEPVKNGPCGSPAPYRLASMGGPGERVTFDPPATLNCQMIAALNRWISRDLQPLARRHLGSPIKRITVMSSYSCRNAYGRTSTRLSEHAKANALDIGGFVTADGQATKLLAHWGPTKRDIEEEARRQRQVGSLKQAESGSQRRKAAGRGTTAQISRGRFATEAAKAASAQDEEARSPKITGSFQRPIGKQAANSERNASTELLPPPPERRPSLRQRLLWAKAKRNRNIAEKTRKSRDAYQRDLHKFLAPRNNLGGPKPPERAKSSSGEEKETQAETDRAAFLRSAHSAACRIFGTVLGPEANDAHRNHFHIDLAYRRRSNYCR